MSRPASTLAGDTDRDYVRSLILEALGRGELTDAECQSRVERVRHARTLGDLQHELRNLKNAPTLVAGKAAAPSAPTKCRSGSLTLGVALLVIAIAIVVVLIVRDSRSAGHRSPAAQPAAPTASITPNALAELGASDSVATLLRRTGFPQSFPFPFTTKITGPVTVSAVNGPATGSTAGGTTQHGWSTTFDVPSGLPGPVDTNDVLGFWRTEADPAVWGPGRVDGNAISFGAAPGPTITVTLTPRPDGVRIGFDAVARVTPAETTPAVGGSVGDRFEDFIAPAYAGMTRVSVSATQPAGADSPTVTTVWQTPASQYERLRDFYTVDSVKSRDPYWIGVRSSPTAVPIPGGFSRDVTSSVSTGTITVVTHGNMLTITNTTTVPPVDFTHP